MITIDGLNRNYLYTIDPGLSGTGYAEWHPSGELRRAGVFQEKLEDANRWWVRGGLMAGRLIRLLLPMRHSNAVIEFPMYMESVAGLAASKGSTLKLAFLIGCYAEAFRRRGCVVQLVTPLDWKGQLPKDVVIRRIHRVISEEDCNAYGIRSHAYDAVGLGLWVRGKL
jgi:hypothetical protein